MDPNFVVTDETLHLGKLLGEGAFGKVYAGELRRVGCLRTSNRLATPRKMVAYQSEIQNKEQ